MDHTETPTHLEGIAEVLVPSRIHARLRQDLCIRAPGCEVVLDVMDLHDRREPVAQNAAHVRVRRLFLPAREREYCVGNDVREGEQEIHRHRRVLDEIVEERDAHRGGILDVVPHAIRHLDRMLLVRTAGTIELPAMPQTAQVPGVVDLELPHDVFVFGHGVTL